MDIETGGTIVPTRLEKERKSKDEVKKKVLSQYSYAVYEFASFSVDHCMFWNVVFIMCCHSFCINSLEGDLLLLLIMASVLEV